MLTCALFMGRTGERRTLAPPPPPQAAGAPSTLVTSCALCFPSGKRRGGRRRPCLVHCLPTLNGAMRLVWATRARRWLRLVTMVTFIMQETCAVCLIWHVSGRGQAVGKCGRPPRCADVDAAKLSSMQSAQKEGLSVLTFLSAVRMFWHVRAGTCAGDPQGCPVPPPGFGLSREPSGWQLD